MTKRPLRGQEAYASLRTRRVLPLRDLGLNSCNPSIVRHDGRLLMTVRDVNYTIAGGYFSQPPNTVNHLLEINPEGDVLSDRLLVEPDPRPCRIGYEDVRLNSVGGELLGTATAHWRDGPGTGGLPGMVMFRIDGNRIVDLDRNDYLETRLPQKNWMPLEGTRVLIQRIDPTVLVLWEDGMSVLRRDRPFMPLGDYRGGTQAIPVDDGWLFLGHAVARGVHRYVHRWMLLDRTLRLAAASPEFQFAGTDGRYDVEFAAGLVRDGDDLLVSYGVNDCAAFLARLSLREVMASVSSAPAPRKSGKPVIVRDPRVPGGFMLA